MRGKKGRKGKMERWNRGKKSTQYLLINKNENVNKIYERRVHGGGRRESTGK